MEKSEVEEALNALKSNENANYLCGDPFSKAFHKKHKAELKKLAKVFIKKNWYKNRFSVGLDSRFLFKINRSWIPDEEVRKITITFLKWVIKRVE